MTSLFAQRPSSRAASRRLKYRWQHLASAGLVCTKTWINIWKEEIEEVVKGAVCCWWWVMTLIKWNSASINIFLSFWFAADLSDRVFVRTFTDSRHAPHYNRFGVNLLMYDLLRSVSVSNDLDQWTGNAHGDGASPLVAHRIDSYNSRALADHGTILGELIGNVKSLLSTTTNWIRLPSSIHSLSGYGVESRLDWSY